MGSYHKTSTSGADDATQASNGTGYQPTFNDNVTASTTSGSNFYSAIRFQSNALAHSENIRSARIELRFKSGMTGAKFDIYGHKVANSPALKATSGAGTADITSGTPSRIATLTTANTQVRISSAPSANDLKISYVFDVTAIVQEIVNQSAWTTGNAITFILKSYTDANFTTSIISNENTTDASQLAGFYVDYGVLDPSAFDFDLISAGDSHGVCACNEGFQVFNVPTFWTAQVVTETYAGMAAAQVGSTGSGSTAGDFFGTGDQRRGYRPNGIVQSQFVDKYGDLVIVFRTEGAVGGTRLDTWAADTVRTGVGLWDGVVAGKPSINTRLQHPLSPSKRAFLWFSIIGNDIKAITNNSQTAASRIVPRGSGWGSTDWSDASDPTKFRNQKVTQLETCLTHAFAQAAIGGTDLRIVLPGYQTFQVFGNNPSFYTFIPAVAGQPLERDVWACEGSGFWAQEDYDLATTSVRPGGDRHNQSTLVKFAAQYQINTYGAWDPNNSAQWNLSLLAVGANPLAETTWIHPIDGVNVDGWKDGMRNITDVTVNEFMVGETHAIIQRVVDLHPEWRGKLYFLPHPQACGVDTTRSADHTSPYAQSPWTVQFDGLHPPASYFDTWTRAVIDDLDTKVDFLPGFIPPGEALVETLAVIDGSGAVIDPSPTSLAVGQRYQRDVQFNAVGGDLVGVFVDVDTLTSQLDGGATMQVEVPVGTVTLTERAINQGDAFTGLGTLLEGQTGNVRVRGVCVS